MKESNYKLLRDHMVSEQLITRGIKDPLTLESMREVPRQAFVPEKLQMASYNDSPLPIEAGQTISQPYIVALMTEAAELDPDSKVLEIGTGSGYGAAVLSRIVKEVFTIERIPILAEHAEKCFKELEYQNIHVKVGDGSLGWYDESPYDAILVTAGAPVVPQSLLHQLKPGGRLVIPVGVSHQRLIRFRKTDEEQYDEEVLELVRFVPLIGEEGWE